MKFILILAAMLVGCRGAEQSNKEEIEPAVKKYLQSLKVGNIDSLIIYKIDTLTTARRLVIMSEEYKSLSDELTVKFDEMLQQAKLQKKILNIVHDKNIYNDLVEKHEEAIKMVYKRYYYDSLSNECLTKSFTADTTDFIGFIARFRLKYSNIESGVQHAVDNGELVISKDFKILDTFIKE